MVEELFVQAEQNRGIKLQRVDHEDRVVAEEAVRPAEPS